MTRRPILADVAALARVSAATASRALRGDPHVDSTTRRAVRGAAAVLGYPLPGGPRAAGATGRVALIVPNLHQPYFVDLAERLVHAVEGVGLRASLRLAPTEHTQQAALQRAADEVDGTILCPHFAVAAASDEDAPTSPVVQLGGPSTPNLDCVLMGEHEGAVAITEHLISIGRHQIALVWDHAAGERERYQGVIAALAAHGRLLDPDLYTVGSDWDRRKSGYEAVAGLLATGRTFDALLCANDAVAIGALRALHVHGIDVPGQVAVTGFDDTDEGCFSTPSLTSVSIEQDSMVHLALTLLQERLSGFDGPARHVTTGARVVARASTVPPSEGARWAPTSLSRSVP